jgi:DNA-binding NtrC family response regulator
MSAVIRNKVKNHGVLRLERNLSTMEKSLASVMDCPRLLVVDDDPLTSALLTSIAGTNGYNVVQVSDGREAYRILKLDSNFRAAIFNINLPHLKGMDLLRYMKTEKRLMRIPVVVVSGAQGLKTVSDSFAAGALAFLPKPLTAARLHSTVRLAISTNREARRVFRPAA